MTPTRKSVPGAGSEAANILTSDDDERLMRATLLDCYGAKPLAFRVSKEHYRYLAEQIISLREYIKRAASSHDIRQAGDE